LAYAGLSTRQWAQLHGYSSAADWRGDECGCTDDRCIGHHHGDGEKCGCLPALIAEHQKNERAGVDGRVVWAAHLHALETGADADRAAAGALAAEWIARYKPGAISFSLNSPRGITVRNRYNTITWLIFDAETGKATVEALGDEQSDSD